MQTSHTANNGNGMSKSFDEAKQNLKEAKDKAGDAVRNVSDQVKSSAADLKDHMKEHVETYSDQVLEYVRKSPLKAIGIAAAIGALLGMAIIK